MINEFDIFAGLPVYRNATVKSPIQSIWALVDAVFAFVKHIMAVKSAIY
jgi:hypothetical protein